MVQVTPPGSACSVSFGRGPGYLELVVDDIDAGRAALSEHGAQLLRGQLPG